MMYRFACLTGLSFFLSMTALMAEDCGCTSCDENAGDPTFVQRDLRRPQQIENLRVEYNKTVQAMELELAQIAALQLGNVASVSRVETRDGTSDDPKQLPAIREKNIAVKNESRRPAIE